MRGCYEIRHNFVIARQGKGYHAAIAFDDNMPMGTSSCVSCGECMVSCPTGALTNKRVLGQNQLGQREALSPASKLLQLPIFKNVSGTFLELNQQRNHPAPHSRPARSSAAKASSARPLSTSSTAKPTFYLSCPIAHVNNRSSSKGFFSKLQSLPAPRRKRQRRSEESGNRTFIPIDASVDLPYDNPIAELGPGDLFGEMTCMSYYPRSATVRAKTDCVMLEMLRNVLDILQRNKTFREQLDRNYRSPRARIAPAQRSDLFKSLTQDFIDLSARPRRTAPLHSRPGDLPPGRSDADSFYLVRIGFVKVSEQRLGGELVLAYLARGGYFGEIVAI